MKHGAQDFKEKLDMFVCGDIKYKAYQGEKNMISWGCAFMPIIIIYQYKKKNYDHYVCVCKKRI